MVRPMHTFVHVQLVHSSSGSLTVGALHQGEHLLPNIAGSYNLLQALVPGLEDRAWMLPPLRTIQTKAGEHLHWAWRNASRMC